LLLIGGEKTKTRRRKEEKDGRDFIFGKEVLEYISIL
jgi:hypothetical protein